MNLGRNRLGQIVEHLQHAFSDFLGRSQLPEQIDFALPQLVDTLFQRFGGLMDALDAA